MRHIGRSVDGSLTSLDTPALTLADAMVGWEDTHRRLQLNAAHIADTRYLTSCLARGDCFLGTGRTVLGTMTYKVQHAPGSFRRNTRVQDQGLAQSPRPPDQATVTIFPASNVFPSTGFATQRVRPSCMSWPAWKWPEIHNAGR